MSDLEVTMMKRIGELNAEVKYLQDKVERLTAEASYDKRVQLHVDKLAAEFTQWEVERLKADLEKSDGVVFAQAVENERLKAEVERLTERLNRHLEINDELDARCTRLRKAGDAMDTLLGPCHASRQWRAAKEGRPNE